MENRSIAEIQDEIIREMAAAEDWLEKYEYLIDQGKKLDGLAEDEKNDENSLPGCQSKVWITCNNQGERLEFRADSDAQIIRGILFLLLRVLNARTPRDIASADLYFIERTGLRANLSPSRANGVGAIVKHMKSRAQK
ncbi:MAG: SufE family protein [Chitinivibrionales bacterium]|nr:SufE family protein [Chitinivibrionales bacterium]